MGLGVNRPAESFHPANAAASLTCEAAPCTDGTPADRQGADYINKILAVG